MSYEKALEAAEFIRSKYNREIKIALVLGSGLGAFADDIENAVKIPYEEIPHFARSTVEGHAGQLVLGEIGGVSVAVQQGRFHFYAQYTENAHRKNDLRHFVTFVKMKTPLLNGNRNASNFAQHKLSGVTFDS